MKDLNDIRDACRIIVNDMDGLTPMLSEGETVLFQKLALRWMQGFRKHKKEVIEGMINDLINMHDKTKAEIILNWFRNMTEREHLLLKKKHGYHLNMIELYTKEFEGK